MPLGQDEDPLAAAMDIEDAGSTQAPSELAAPLVSESIASVAASDTEREGSQSSFELIGPLATLPFSSNGGGAAHALRDQEECRPEMEHEGAVQSKKSSEQCATTAAPWVIDRCGTFAVASNTTRPEELLQYFADAHINQERKFTFNEPGVYVVLLVDGKKSDVASQSEVSEAEWRPF